MVITSEADAFLGKVKDFTYAEMRAEVQREIIRARQSKRVDDDHTNYFGFLMGFRWFLQEGTKPAESQWSDFQRLKPIAERLIATREMSPSLLNEFSPSKRHR